MNNSLDSICSARGCEKLAGFRVARFKTQLQLICSSSKVTVARNPLPDITVVPHEGVTCHSFLIVFLILSPCHTHFQKLPLSCGVTSVPDKWPDHLTLSLPSSETRLNLESQRVHLKIFFSIFLNLTLWRPCYREILSHFDTSTSDTSSQAPSP